ncbi:MAG: PrsW family glutamic-type intramembrane protease [bacterium]|nr:PrsW family glutamic-type intramembrane protease [bacterium]
MFDISTTTIVILVLLACLPALAWTFVYRQLDKRDPEPYKAIAFSTFLGLVATLPVFALQFFFTYFPDLNLVSLLQTTFNSTISFSLVFLIFVAVIEETVKAIAFIYAAQRFEHVFNQIVDGIIYAAAIGLGFALAENVYYFFRAYESFGYSSNFFAIFTIRSLGTMLAHTFFTGVFGFYFARAYFAPFVDEGSKQERLWHNLGYNLSHAIRLHATFFHLLPAEKRESFNFSIKRNVMVLEGFIMAVFLHLVYNFLIKVELFGQHFTFLIVPALFISAWYLWGRFFIPMYTRIVDFIRLRKSGEWRVRVH